MRAKKILKLAFILGAFFIGLGAVQAGPELPAIPAGFGPWQTASVGDFMTVKIPGKFKVSSLELDAEVRKKIDLMETYTLDNANGDDYQCLVSYIIYNKGIMADLDGAANGAINNMGQQTTISDFKAQKKYVDLPTAKGILVTGSYMSAGKKGMFYSIIYAKRNLLWMVVTMDTDGNKLYQVTRTIINSIQINAK